MTHKLTGREVYDDDGFRQQARRCHPDASGANEAMTEQGVLSAISNRLRAYRADDLAVNEKT
jgi:hypothetical protein